MGSQNKSSGQLLTAGGFAFFLLFLSGVGTYLVVKQVWWFPKSISTIAPFIDKQFNITMAITGVIFVLAQVFLGVFIFQFRDRGRPAEYSHGNIRLEIVWTSVTAVIFIGLALMAKTAWADLHFIGPAPGAMQVEVTGEQFNWTFRYPGPDGQFGMLDPNRINDASGNTLGLDYSEPAAKDDVVTSEMAIPVNRPIEVILRSKDVIHSFFVPQLRIKQDTVPGLVIRIHFTAIETGEFELACAELCGLGHYRMRSNFKVLSEEGFRAWLKEEAAQ